MKNLPTVSQSQLKAFRKLTLKKHRDADKMFLIEGPHLVSEALRSSAKVTSVLISPSFKEKNEFQSLIHLASKRDIPVFTAGEEQIRSLSDTVTTQGIVAVVRRTETHLEWETRSDTAIRVVLDDVADPGNVGTIIRTCDWFGIDAVVLGGSSTELENPKVLRAAMGSTFHIPVVHETNLHAMLTSAKAAGWHIATTVPSKGVRPQRKFLLRPCCMIFGNEARGISHELLGLAEQTLTIPGAGNAESLNVAVTCGIILAEMSETR